VRGIRAQSSSAKASRSRTASTTSCPDCLTHSRGQDKPVGVFGGALVLVSCVITGGPGSSATKSTTPTWARWSNDCDAQTRPMLPALCNVHRPRHRDNQCSIKLAGFIVETNCDQQGVDALVWRHMLVVRLVICGFFPVCTHSHAGRLMRYCAGASKTLSSVLATVPSRHCAMPSVAMSRRKAPRTE
jgi:hypothetical protein